MSAEPAVLAVSDLHLRLGRTEVLRGVALAVSPGERLALIGPNGAGKSSLFGVISGAVPPTRGQVWLQGRRVDGLAPHRIHRLGLARSFQISRLFGGLTVRENLECALLQPLGYGRTLWRRLARLGDLRERCDALLQQWALSAVGDTPVAQLTHAEQRALEVAMALAADAPVVLLDEPTSGMSRAESDRFVERIRAATTGRTLVMVEHDMDVVFALADRIAVLVRGQVIACGPPEAVRADPCVQAAYLGSALPIRPPREAA